jgi:Glycosyl transferase 4-like domain
MMPHRVLMVSPHFPPDSSAGAHRVRLLAPHLRTFGWEPTVLTVDPRDYEGQLDPRLVELVPLSLRVIRCRAWSVRWTRRFGIGDLGLRAFRNLYKTCCQLLTTECFDVLFVTLLPGYPALLGHFLKSRFRIPFVLDYQDPWVGAWGKTVGGGPGGTPDLKSRATRRFASWLEPWAVQAADAITAVSSGTFEAVLERNPAIKSIPCAAIPLGGESADFEYLRRRASPNPFFDPVDGNFHLCYVGTLLPLGMETLRAFLRAAGLLKKRRPEQYQRLRLHFFGTSNQRERNAPQRVIPVAKEFEVDDCVTEVAPRIDYLDALTVLTQASGILMMGSSEKHYTASKLYPGLHARRPILAVYHEASSVVDILRSAGQPPNIRMITYDDVHRAESQAETVYCELSAMLCDPEYDAAAVHMEAVSEFSAGHLAGKMAEVFNSAVQKRDRSAAPVSE